MRTCFECDEIATHAHHVVPRVRGGTRTVWLCGRCHGFVHNAPLLHTGALTSVGLARVRAEGRHTGGRVPYGYRLVGGDRLERDEGEQQVIAGARRLRAAGMSLREVAKTLRAASYVSRSGREFAASAIAAMCREPDTAAV